MWPTISLYIRTFIMIIGVFIFPKIVLNEKIKISNKKFLLLFIIMMIIQKNTYANLTGIIKTIVYIASNVVFYRISFKLTIKKSLLLSIIYMFLLIIPELIELYFLTSVLGMSREFCYNTYAGGFISNILILILFVVITYIIRKFLKKLVDENLENNTKIIIFVILIFICTGMFFYTMIKEFRFSDDIFLYLIAMIVLILVLYSLIRQTIQNNKLTEKYDKLLEFMKTYEIEIENQRILRHETKNEFLAIRSKIQDKQENEEILKYIDVILNDKIEVKQEQYAKFGYLPANGIKGLCYFKVQEAETKGIKVSLNISKKIENSTIYDLDIKQQREFGRILGVFLDNAIEASNLSEEKKLGIETYVNKNKEFKMIISNSYSNEIDKNKIGKESFSTKGKGRGHGLLLVKRITNNNQIFETEKNIQEKIYSQTITIKK